MKVKCKSYRIGDPAVYAHAKLDGHFTRIVKSETGQVKVFTSHPTDITVKIPPRLLRPFHSQVPNKTVVLGELWVDGEPASSVKTHLKLQSSALRFSAFAVLETPQRMTNRNLECASLNEVRDLCSLWGIPFAPFVSLTDGWTIEDLYKRAKIDEYEGWVLKDGNVLNWRKLKEQLTIDLVVTGFEEGEGKYAGQVGSLICSTYEGHIIANVSGMDDETREAISYNRHRYVGRVVEVGYQYVGSKGKLRHPAFKQFRDDKAASECCIDQDTKLEEYYL